MRRALHATVFAVLALAAAGCGSDSSGSDPGASTGEVVAIPTEPAPQDGKVPAVLLRNASEVNAIVPGGQEELDRRLAELRGHPVIVNRWASWCDPCREELPFFNEAARLHKDEVAFVGLNTQDEIGAAERFLTDYPFPGPSVEDQSGEVAQNLGIGTVSPGTVFIDPQGEIVFTRPGAYATADELEADIRTYLFGS